MFSVVGGWTVSQTFQLFTLKCFTRNNWEEIILQEVMPNMQTIHCMRQWRLDHWGQGASEFGPYEKKATLPPLKNFSAPSESKRGPLTFFDRTPSPPPLGNLQASLAWGSKLRKFALDLVKFDGKTFLFFSSKIESFLCSILKPIKYTGWWVTFWTNFQHLQWDSQSTSSTQLFICRPRETIHFHLATFLFIPYGYAKKCWNSAF